MWVVPTVAVDNNCRCQVDVAEGPVEITYGDIGGCRVSACWPVVRLIIYICAVYAQCMYSIHSTHTHTHSASVMRVNDVTFPVALVNRMNSGSELS